MISPSGELPGWLVRIRPSADDPPVGAGVYCGGGCVLTCAHVVTAIAAEVAPAHAVYLEFQYAERPALIEAVVAEAGWSPDRPDGSGDLAVLRVAAGTVPADARAARFGPTHSGLSGHRFRAHGYPRGHEREGVLATGTIVGPAGRDFLQLQADSALGYALEAGFSGAPVLDIESDTVVGIVATRDRARPDGTDPRTGYAVPSEVLATFWPAIALSAHEPPVDLEHLRALLEVHRRNVRILEQQEAKFGDLSGSATET